VKVFLDISRIKFLCAFNNGAKAATAVKGSSNQGKSPCGSITSNHPLGSITLAISLSLNWAIASIWKNKFCNKEKKDDQLMGFFGVFGKPTATATL